MYRATVVQTLFTLSEKVSNISQQISKCISGLGYWERQTDKFGFLCLLCRIQTENPGQSCLKAHQNFSQRYVHLPFAFFPFLFILEQRPRFFSIAHLPTIVNIIDTYYSTNISLRPWLCREYFSFEESYLLISYSKLAKRI